MVEPLLLGIVIATTLFTIIGLFITAFTQMLR